MVGRHAPEPGERRLRFAWVAGPLLAFTSSCASPSFVCGDDSDCSADGECQWSNYCAFPDPDCESGMRYGDHAGEFSGLCVGPPPPDTDPMQTESASTGDASGSEPPSTEGGSSAESGDSGEQSCSCFDPPAGGEWEGPTLLQTAGSLAALPACPAAAADNVLDGLGGFAVDPPQCTYLPADCSATVPLFESPLCENEIDSIALSSGECVNTAGWTKGGGAYLGAFECLCNDPGGAVGDFPEPSWSSAGRVCAGEAASCDDVGRCLPTPSAAAGESICIYAEGDVECPLVGYSNKILLYSGLTDTRECSVCEVEGPACGIGISVSDCSDIDYLYVEDGGGKDCVDAQMFGKDASIFVVDVLSEACGEEPTPSGAVTPTGATTVCCL